MTTKEDFKKINKLYTSEEKERLPDGERVFKKVETKLSMDTVSGLPEAISEALTKTQIVEYAPSSDANNITTQWVLGAGTNYPDTGFWYMNTIFYSATSGNAKQIAYRYNTNEIATRYRQEGVWSGWGFATKPPSLQVGRGGITSEGPIVAENGMKIVGSAASNSFQTRSVQGITTAGDEFDALYLNYGNTNPVYINGSNTVYHTGNIPTQAKRWPTWSEVTGRPYLFDNSKYLGTDNLNNIQTPGVYHQDSNANTSAARNYPINYAGTLIVTNAAGILQEYTAYGTYSDSKYVRGIYSGSWSAWTKISTVQVGINAYPSSPKKGDMRFDV